MTAPVVFFLQSDIFNTPPAAVLVGDTLYITGQHFATAIDVSISGVSVPFTIDSDTDIHLTMPGVVSGVVVVTNSDGSSSDTLSALHNEVVVCTPGPWLTLPNSYWSNRLYPLFPGVEEEELHLRHRQTAGITLADAWATTPTAGDHTSDNAGSAHSPADAFGPGTPEGSAASEGFIRVDFTSLLTTAFLDVFEVEQIGGVTAPTDAAALRYENNDGHLTLVPGGGQKFVVQVSANKAANSIVLTRLGTGHYEDDAALEANWIAPGSYPPAVATIAMTSAMSDVRGTDVTVIDPGGLDSANRVGYAVLPLDTDGADLDLSIIDQNYMAFFPLSGGPLMSAPRYRWIYPLPPPDLDGGIGPQSVSFDP